MMSTMRGARGQDGQVVLDLLAELLQLVADLVAAERGQALQAQIEDGAGLLVGEADGAAGRRACGADRRSARPAGRCPWPASRAPSSARALPPGSARCGSAGSSRRCWRPPRRGPPTRGRGRATWPSRCLVRRLTTSSRKAVKAAIMSLRLSCSGRPPLIASMLAPKLVCRSEWRQSWFSTTSAMASRFSSMTMRMPSRLVSSQMSAMPSISLLAHLLGDLLDQRALVDLIGNGGDDQRLAVLADLLGVHLGAHA